MTPITLSFQYTEADYQEFLRHFFMRNRSRMYLILAVLMLVALTVTQGGDIFTLKYLLSVVLPVAMVLGLWWYLIRFMGRRTFRSAPQMQEGRNCIIGASMITIQGHTFSTEFSWSGVLQVVETSKLFLVYNSASSAIMLPKRAFAAGQIEQFRQLVDELPDIQVKWRT
ncbi:MAG: YcxB family protein [Bacteroidetes bacterium]|nr:MAG: YcxB family protein [Bacteroidota bacterium]